MQRFLALTFVLLLSALAIAQQTRVLAIDDLAKIHQIGDPQISPDGQWIAYTVSNTDVGADKRDTDIWMVSWDGAQHMRMTQSPEAESSPRWSPDGKLLTFTSSRPGKAKGSQVWALDRRGGEAYQLTDFKQNLSGYVWSPDSKKLALVLREKDDPDADPAKPPAEQAKPKPVVIDRYHFKQDLEGYLTGLNRARIFLYDLETKKLDPLTNEKDFDESNPEWSPDGTRIAFVSKRAKDWDRDNNTDVWVVDATGNGTPKRLTQFAGPDGGKLSWSPDGRLIAYTQGSDPRLGAYNQTKLAVVAAEGGGDARILTSKLDRNISQPVFSPDGKSINALVADDRVEYPAQVDATTGAVEKSFTGKRVVAAHSYASGHTAVVSSSDETPSEIYALEAGKLRKLTSHNDALFAEFRFGVTEDFTCKAKDGTEVHGLLLRPPDSQPGRKLPALLRIHGGPNGQDAHAYIVRQEFFRIATVVITMHCEAR